MEGEECQWTWVGKCGKGRTSNTQHPTSNTQHPTSNIQHPMQGPSHGNHWMLGVGCWVLDVPAFYKFLKNFRAVSQVASLNSSAEQAFVAATTSDNSFT